MTTGLRTKTVSDNDWILEFCNFTEAWALSPPRPGGKQKGEGITVVHPDTGYTDHPELKQDNRYYVSLARNFLQVPRTPRAAHIRSAYPAVDDLRGSSASHGTKTASVLMSAEGKPDPVTFPGYTATNFVSGVAPKVTVIPYRVTDWVNLTDETGINLSTSIYYALDKLNLNNLGVISISLGRSTTGSIEQEGHIRKCLKEARKKGVIVCAAAGQLQMDNANGDWLGGKFDPAFPSQDPNALCVAGCKADHSAIKSGFLGPEVDITAPAFDLWVAASKKEAPQYEVYQSWGTSYATAIVAGACALWQAYHGRTWLLDPNNYGPELILTLFKEVLKRSSHKPSGWDAAKRGVGVLDAEALLLEPLPTKADVELLDKPDE